MRMFWTLFFLGSMLLVGVDVSTRRQQSAQSSQLQTEKPGLPMSDGSDPLGLPTPIP